MNDELHNKVVKFFYDHEELFIAIMNKTPYQSDGWDYEIEVVKEFLTANQSCYCGDIYNLGVIHRDDGPCHYPNDKEPEPEPVAWITNNGDGWLRWHRAKDNNSNSIPLYTTPPQPVVNKSLTTEQILHFVDIHVGAPSMAYPLDNSDWITFARAIEAAHGIKE